MIRRVLIVDDDRALAGVLDAALTDEGFVVTRAENGVLGLRAFEAEGADLLILDVLMPDMDGLELCRRLRRKSRVPVILLSSRGEEIDRVTGLETGADDYVTKPFSTRELVARIRALDRRLDPPGGPAVAAPSFLGAEVVEAGPLRLDPARFEARWRGKAVTLTRSEFQILQTLVRNRGQVLARERLLDMARGDEAVVTDRTVDTFIKRLRKKFCDVDAGFAEVETVFGVATVIKTNVRGLRARVMRLGVALLVLPLFLIGAADAYEWTVARRQRDELGRAAAEAAAADPATQARIAAQSRALVGALDSHGVVVTRARAADIPLEHSAIGTVGEHLVGARDHLVTLEAADALGPPWSSRPEVREALAGRRAFGRHLTPGGEALLITLAEPTADGGVLYLVSGSYLGIRRLEIVQRQLVQLLIYELVLALPLVIWFAFSLVRPLERLAAAARRYPAAPLADAALLRRRDEIGALSRTLARMAEDLDARRRGAADLGADIAHEFKNPLASIAASAELLSSGAPPTGERLALATTTIAGSVERLRRSIDELLRLLRMEDAMAHEARTPVVVSDLLRALADEYRRDPRHAGWSFDVVVDASAEALATPLDRARVTEMLRNLADNALVQPAAERRLVFGLGRVGGDLVISIRDHGPGISRENQARVFGRFFTQRPAGAPEGTGLGLSIVDSIARAHGGRVEIVSEPGHGAELRVLLPL